MKSFIDSAREHGRSDRVKGPSLDMGQARIVVIGCGGAGNNTVKRLMTIGVQGAECIAINTDRQHLAVTTAHRKLLMPASSQDGTSVSSQIEMPGVSGDHQITNKYLGNFQAVDVHLLSGELAEWSKAADLGSALFGGVRSNRTLVMVNILFCPVNLF